MNLKKLVLSALSLFAFALSSNVTIFANSINDSNNNIVLEEANNKTEEDELKLVQCIVLSDSNIWQDEEGFYAENKELVKVIPANSKVWLIGASDTTNYALCIYLNNNEVLVGYISKDNLRLY